MNKTSRIFLQPHTAVAHQENMIRSRRGFLKGIALGAAAVIAAPVLSRASAYAAEAGGNKVLILYFSHSGNTRRLAGQIHGRVGGDMVELKTVVPYPQDYDAVVRNRVRRRLREIFRLNQGGLAQGYDMILVARTRAVGAEYRELERAFLNVCGKLGLREKKP